MTDVLRVKDAARGRWDDLLVELGGIDPFYLDGKHRPCPRCEGKDRFRFTNMNGDGSVLCNQCFRCGDGIAALQWLRDWDFPTTLHRLAVRLGIGKDSSWCTPACDSRPVLADHRVSSSRIA